MKSRGPAIAEPSGAPSPFEKHTETVSNGAAIARAVARGSALPSATAALHALEHHVDRLADDHALAARLFDGIAGLPGLAVERPQTNIVFADVTNERAAGLIAHLRTQGVLATGGKRLRFVTHLDVDRAGIDCAIAAMSKYLND